MTSGMRSHPDVIFVRLTEDTGYGLTFLGDDVFSDAADRFLVRALYHEDAGDTPEVRKQLCDDFLWRVFKDPSAEEYSWENVRWIAAASVREKYRDADSIARVVMIEHSADTGESGGIVIRPAPEFLDHPGWPRAVIVGHPVYGGGPAQFFADRADFEAASQRPLTDREWLPQIVSRLYETTPSVVMGVPKQSKEGDMSVQCRALSFGTTAKLLERH